MKRRNRKKPTERARKYAIGSPAEERPLPKQHWYEVKEVKPNERLQKSIGYLML